MQNETYTLEIDPNDTTLQIKYKIEEQLNLGYPETFKIIHHGKILKNDQTPLFKMNDFLIVMVKMYCRFEINDKCYMEQTYIRSKLNIFKTFQDFQSDIASNLDDDIYEFNKYYDFFINGQPLEIEDSDDFGNGDNVKQWWKRGRSLNVEIRSKDNKFWYKQHYQKRMHVLTIGFIRITTKKFKIFLPSPIQQLCNKYYIKC